MKISIKREQSQARLSYAERTQFGAKLNTKNIFNVLAFVMLMSTMLLTIACNSDNDAIVNNENTAEKGYPLQVTVNVSRQGDDATRAEYDVDNKKLSFSSGDQLFVSGDETTAGSFAGALTWVSGGTFRGTITTKNAYTGTADALFTAAFSVSATLLPAHYEDYDYFYIYPNNGYNATVIPLFPNKAFALTKKIAVEQFSYEYANTYSSGFTLTPHNAILSFTIAGLSASTDVDVAFTGPGSLNINKTVTTDAYGKATFAIGAAGLTNISQCSLTVGGYPIERGSHALVAGHIYNITRSITPSFTMAAAATDADKGKLICTDGHMHAYGADAGCKAPRVARIVYVGALGEAAPYNHGLALAMEDVSNNKLTWDYSGSNNDLQSADEWCTAWNTSTPVSSARWLLASQSEWGSMLSAEDTDNALRDGFESVGGTNMQPDIYWSSTEDTNQPGWIPCWDFYSNNGWCVVHKTTPCYVRACLAF